MPRPRRLCVIASGSSLPRISGRLSIDDMGYLVYYQNGLMSPSRFPTHAAEYHLDFVLGRAASFPPWSTTSRVG
jgi:hypothetical protein